ncbi:MAG: hypothetical protein JWO62_1440 [Acidimicrobiaceae bacterium]|nr:hypothetical protein [Acidimicrobiaceae bacterium]
MSVTGRSKCPYLEFPTSGTTLRSGGERQPPTHARFSDFFAILEPQPDITVIGRAIYRPSRSRPGSGCQDPGTRDRAHPAARRQRVREGLSRQGRLRSRVRRLPRLRDGGHRNGGSTASPTSPAGPKATWEVVRRTAERVIRFARQILTAAGLVPARSVGIALPGAGG